MANRIVSVHAGIYRMGIYAIMLPSSGFSVAHSCVFRYCTSVSLLFAADSATLRCGSYTRRHVSRATGQPRSQNQCSGIQSTGSYNTPKPTHSCKQRYKIHKIHQNKHTYKH